MKCYLAMMMFMYNNVGGHLKRNGCRSLDIIVRPLWSAVDRLSQSFAFQNVRFDRRVKRARLEQSGVKSTADDRWYCRGVCTR